MPVVTTLQDNNEKTELLIEGQSYNFDERTGMWTVWSLSNLAAVGPAMSIFELFRRAKEENIVVFQKRQIMKVNPTVYFYRSKKNLKLHLTHQIEPGKPGSTSIIWNSVFKDAANGIILVQKAVKLVTADITSRKPLPVPTWFRTKYTDIEKLNDFPKLLSIKSDLPDIPSRSYIWRTRVRHSDLDANMHTNQSVYLKLCIDAATSAALSGKLKHFNSDMCLYPLETFDITFTGESFPDNELIVYAWQEEVDMSVFHFVIQTNGKPITYLTCKYGQKKLSSNFLSKF